MEHASCADVMWSIVPHIGISPARIFQSAGNRNRRTCILDKIHIKLSGVLLAVFLMGCVVFAPAEPVSLPEQILNGMTLEEKVEQMCIPAFRRVGSANPLLGNTEPVTEVTEELSAYLENHRFGGILLFAENCETPEKTAELIRSLQDINAAHGGIPLLIGADQEGGTVVRLDFGTAGIGNMALSATGDPAYARRMGEIIGEEMRSLGFNLDFAPSVDINNNPMNPIIGLRSFSDDPYVTAAFGTAFLSGLSEAGMIGTLKHFPGHGNTDTDSHSDLPCVDLSYEELECCELIPFMEGIRGGAEVIMTSHIQFPQIETGTYSSILNGETVYLPATMSRTILTDILRDKCGFDGVIVSDSLEMSALTDHFSTEDILRMTINAGVDLLLLPPVYNDRGYEIINGMVGTILGLVGRGGIEESRIDEAVLRILTLKERHGLLEPRETAPALPAQYPAHAEEVFDMAGKAITLLKNENGAYPISCQAGERVLVISGWPSRAGAGDAAAERLHAMGQLQDVEIITMVISQEEDDSVIEMAENADHVIVLSFMSAPEEMDPYSMEGLQCDVIDRVIDAVHYAGHSVTLISGYLPYDASRYPSADAILLTYGSTRMTDADHVLPGSMPNLIAGICAALGLGNAEGSLPLDLPEIDARYRFTSETEWERQVTLPPK